jgi:5'-AMP-activated protein kinase, regulatory gamma subunit
LFRNNQTENECGFVPKGRFDNSSFIRSLESSISNGSVDSGHNTGGSSSSSNNSKEKLSKNHHHHSIQEMIKHLSKKVHLWSRSRHDSINENEISNDRRTSTPEPTYVMPENFRSRSKSLDVTMSRRILDDCESTYKIYNKILKEGNLKS